MQLLERVLSNVKLCGIEIAFGGVMVPSAVSNWQPFYNGTLNDTFYTVFSSISRIDFTEESFTNNAGTSYKQKVSFRFKNGDANRSERIELLRKIKYIKIKQTNALDIVVGRNDYYQNTPPTVKVKADEQNLLVEIETQSIMPCGFVPGESAFGLPVLTPITL